MTHPPLFRDLSDAEQGALLLAMHRGQMIEFFDATGEWWLTPDAAFNDMSAYRIAPTPDTIDWSHVAPEWRFAKRSASDTPFMFREDPRANKPVYFADGDIARVTTPSFRNNGMPWDQSLIERPENG